MIGRFEVSWLGVSRFCDWEFLEKDKKLTVRTPSPVGGQSPAALAGQEPRYLEHTQANTQYAKKEIIAVSVVYAMLSSR